MRSKIYKAGMFKISNKNILFSALFPIIIIIGFISTEFEQKLKNKRLHKNM